MLAYTRLRLLICGLLIMLAAVACTDEAEIDPSDPVYCGGDETISCEGDRLKICGADGRWAFEACDQLCANLGLIYGGDCAMDDERGHDFCQCVEDCCTEGEQRCTGDNVEICRSCEWTLVDCSAYCENYGLESQGCGIDEDSDTSTCLCEGLDTSACSADMIKCREGFVNVCSDAGGYSAVSCRQQCETQGYYFESCQVDMEGPAETCHCSDVPESEICQSTQPTCMGDSIAVCTEGTVGLLSCADECTALGLSLLGCGRDADRGHDVCQCGTLDVVDGDTPMDGDTPLDGDLSDIGGRR